VGFATNAMQTGVSSFTIRSLTLHTVLGCGDRNGEIIATKAIGAPGVEVFTILDDDWDRQDSTRKAG
jgi:hypothetical protein